MRLAGTLSTITTVAELQTWIRERRGATLLVYAQGKAYLAEVRRPGVGILAHGATLSEAVERVTRRFDKECGSDTESSPRNACGQQHGEFTCDNPSGHEQEREPLAHGATLPNGTRVNW